MNRKGFIHGEWFELGAGIMLLIHAATFSLSDSGDGPGNALSAIFIFSFASLFLSHVIVRRRALRTALLLVVAAGFSTAASDAFGAKDLVTLFLYGIWLCGLILSERAVRAGLRDSGEDEEGPDLTAFLVGAALFAFGTAFAGAGVAPAWFRPHFGTILFGGNAYLLSSLVFVLAGSFLIASEFSAWDRRLRIGIRFGAAAFPLAIGLSYLFGGSPVAAMPFFLLTVLLPGTTFASAIHLEPAGLEEGTSEQKTVYSYERAGQIAIWTIIGASGGFVLLGSPVDFGGLFGAYAVATLVSILYYYLSPIRSYTEKNYLISLLALAGAFDLVWWTNGGLASPYTFLSFIIIIGAAVVIRPYWVVIFSVGLWSVPAAGALSVTAPGGVTVDFADFLLYSIALAVLTLYAYLIAMKREKHAIRIEHAEDAMKEALREEEEIRSRFEAKAKRLEDTNRDLVEMRTALLNVLEDMEESKRELQSDQRREEAIFAALGEGVIAADRDGRIILTNDMAEKMLGKKRVEILGRPIESILRFRSGEGDVIDTSPFTQAFSGKANKLADDLTLIGSGGELTPVAGSSQPFLDDRERFAGIVVAIRDVTIEREIDQEKSSFISVASHQLRTPINAIRWYVDLLLEGDAGRLKGQQKEFLADISTSVVRMAALIDDLLQVYRAEEGKMRLEPVHVAPKESLDALLKEIGAAAEKRSQEFVVDVADRLPEILVDRTALVEVVENLLSNAVKYTPEGGRIGLKVAKDGEGVRFEVWDTGYGIPKDQQRHVFEKFFRGKRAVSMETEGTGLGLYIAKRIVELSGGDLTFESTVGKGTRFRFTLPSADKADHA